MKLVLLRHGKSVDNAAGLFSGWHDCELSDAGRAESRLAGEKLKAAGFRFDIAFTSFLRRAKDTLAIVLGELGQGVPVQEDWRLNERHYGALQQKKHIDAEVEFGAQQVKIWRRSFSARPPLLQDGDPRILDSEPRYEGIPVPRGESLADVILRVVSCFEEEIAPQLRAGKRVLIVASGNSLRALVKYLDGIPDDKISELNIPTGIPLVYELDESLKPLGHNYLASREEVEAGLSWVKPAG